MPIVQKPWTSTDSEWRESNADPALVGQREWCFLIPRLHQALANPAARHEFPRLAHDGRQEPVHAFWETGLYLLQLVMGWSDPGRGLRWWLENDQQTLGSPALTLLRDIWAADEDFGLFAGWCWVHGASNPHFTNLVGELADVRRLAQESERSPSTFRFGDWWERAKNLSKSGTTHRGPDPFSGGTNPLHLSHSIYGGTTELQGTLLRSEPAERRATLMLDRASGWYRQLLLHGRSMPVVGTKSWKVDVVVKPLGWLGTYRRSGDTGLWFQGKHSIHMKGQSV